jgi:hypothetical protein
MNFDDTVELIAQAAAARYRTAVEDEGMKSLDAMREIVRTILTEYRDRMAS